jgi:hypothetical protein
MRLRRLTTLTAATALAAPVAVGLTAGPAAAASAVSGPATVTEHGTFTVTGVLDEGVNRTGVAELRVSGNGYERAVARASRPSTREPQADPNRVSYGVATAPCTLPDAAFCGGGGVLPNGRYAVRLFEVDRPPDGGQVERGQSAGGGTPFSVLVDVPALRPEDVTAALSGRTVTVSWARGVGADRSLVEPDVRWVVSDNVGRSAPAGPGACSGGTCRATLTYPDDEAGPRTFTVTASRPCEGCANSGTSSTPTAPVVVPVVPGATPGPGDREPSPGSGSGQPGSGGSAGTGSGGSGGTAGTGGGSGGTGGTGTGTADPSAFARGFSSFEPKLGLPKLPPLPQADAPAVAAPLLPDGTFDDELDYGRERPLEALEEPSASRGRESVLRSTEGLPVSEELVRGVAAALVLVLSGAHLRTWLGRPEED